MGNEHVGMDRPYSEENPELSKDIAAGMVAGLMIVRIQIKKLEEAVLADGKVMDHHLKHHKKLEERVALLEAATMESIAEQAALYEHHDALKDRVAKLEKELQVTHDRLGWL